MERQQDRHHHTERTRRIIALVALLAVVAVLALIFVRFGTRIIELVADPEAFKSWIDGYGARAYGVYVGLVALQVLLAVIPGGPFQIAGGYAFGAFWGTLLCLVGCTLGSMAVFGLVRLFGRRFVELFVPAERIERLHRLEESRRFKALFVALFLLPGSPKDVMAYLAGLTTIRWQSWLLICSLGRVPAIIASALSGDAIGKSRYLRAGVIYGILLLVSVGGYLVYQRMSGRGSGDKN